MATTTTTQTSGRHALPYSFRARLLDRRPSEHQPQHAARAIHHPSCPGRTGGTCVGCGARIVIARSQPSTAQLVERLAAAGHL